MFNVEKMLKVPVLPKGHPYLSPDGCGCAVGIAYAGSHNVNWTAVEDYPNICVDNNRVGMWSMELLALNPRLWAVLKSAEARLMHIGADPNPVLMEFEDLSMLFSFRFRKRYQTTLASLQYQLDDMGLGYNHIKISDLSHIDTPEGIKKWMIDQIVDLGLANDVAPIKEELCTRV